MRSTTDATAILLVGGGVASVRCARTLRKEGFDGRILLVGDEPDMPYNRPPLSKELLRENLPDDLVLAEPERWYERRGIELLTGRRVVGLDLEAKEATLDDAKRIPFDRCLLATGAEPRSLQASGAGEVILLRTLADARHLRAAAVAAGQGAPVVVIGGGFIGVEVASSLRVLGLGPTIVEMADRLWSGRLGSELAAWANDRLTAAGIGVRLGARVERIADGVWVDGEHLAGALVVGGVGVRPRDDLARAAGLRVDDGIVVDAEQRTSHPAAWAAGDVARHGPVRIEHWHAAREGGERAARSMLDLSVASAPEPWFFSEVAGVPVDVVGSAPAWDEERWVSDGLLAYLEGRRVVQLASIDSAMDAARMREIVALRQRVEAVAWGGD